MQLRLIDPLRGECPQDGYRYVDPEDGFVVHAWTYVDWVDIARRHLETNNRPVPGDLGEKMQNQLCQTLRPGLCLYDDPSRPRPSTSLSWNDVAAGIKTFTRWIAKGAKFVDQREAERRAVICSRCYLNVNVQGCSGCQKAVVEITGDRKTKQDSVLRSCAVCKCFLRSKVHFPIETLDTQSDKVQSMYPDFCWLNPNSENYVATATETHGSKEELDPGSRKPKA